MRRSIEEVLKAGGKVEIVYEQCFEANLYEANYHSPLTTGWGSDLQSAWDDLLRGIPLQADLEVEDEQP